jgi:ABC-type antimicrobial peptide transport system permease subunit
VVPTVRQRPLQDAPDPDPVVYIPHIQNLTHRNGSFIIVRARSNPGAFAAQLRHEMFALDPDLPLTNIRTMDERLARYRWPSRVFGTMFAVLAAIALTLAGVGLYAVTAHAVTQRTPEIGLRRALGAQSAHIVWLAARDAVIHLAIGLALGLAGAIGVGKLLTTVLVQTTPTDFVTLASIAGILLIAATVACLMPIRRALALDPATVLRYE